MRIEKPIQSAVQQVRGRAGQGGKYCGVAPISLTCIFQKEEDKAIQCEKNERLTKKSVDQNDRRERLVKASRDITSASKKAIFQLHRAEPGKAGGTLKSAAQMLERIRERISSRVAAELQGGCESRFRRYYSPGIQEYVEAREMLEYLREGRLMGVERMQAELDEACEKEGHGLKVRLEEGDYVLGVADVTGELMRQAVGKGGKGDVEGLMEVWMFLQGVWNEMVGFEGFREILGKDYEGKMKIMKTSLEKVERTCFDLAIRRAEMGEVGYEGLKRRRVK